MGETQRTPIFVLSDGTGDTAAAVAQATTAQFQVEWSLRRFGDVRHEALARRVVGEAEKQGARIVFTLVDKRVAQALLEEAERRGVPTLDVLGAMISKVADHVSAEPRSQPGLPPGGRSRRTRPGSFASWKVTRGREEARRVGGGLLGFARPCSLARQRYAEHAPAR